MLDKRDLQAIAALLDEKLDKKLDERFSQFEERLETKWSKQLGERLAEFEERQETKWNRQLEEGFAEFEERLETKWNKQLGEKINSLAEILLNELALTQDYLEKRIDRLDAKMDEIDQYYRIRRLDDDNIGMILKIIEELSGRVDKLEAAIVH